MSTALAVRQNGAIDRFGDEQDMQTMMHRGAAIFQVAQADLARPQVQGALMKAMQFTLSYGAMPGRHVHLIPFTKNEKIGNEWVKVTTYSVSDSYEWRKASADQKSRLMGWQYMLQTEQLTPDEVRAYVTENAMGGPYDEKDRGFRSRAKFVHEAKIAQMCGDKYDPPWHYGFWRKNSYSTDEYDNGKKTGKVIWKPDTVPTGRTPEWQAMKRAEKSALAQHFELLPIGNWEQLNERQRQAQIEDSFLQEEPDADLINADAINVAPSFAVVEPDGDILFERAEPRRTVSPRPLQPQTVTPPAKAQLAKQATEEKAKVAFANAEEALQWGLSKKCFRHHEHAKNAYEKLKTENKPKTAADMFALWIGDVERRVKEIEQGGSIEGESQAQLVDNPFNAEPVAA